MWLKGKEESKRANIKGNFQQKENSGDLVSIYSTGKLANVIPHLGLGLKFKIKIKVL